MANVRLVLYTEDPFFQKQAVLKVRGVTVLRSPAELHDLFNTEDTAGEVGFIVDLMSHQLDSIHWIARIRQHFPNATIVGLVHPAAAEKKMAAKLAGAQYVLPRDSFPMLLEWIEQYFTPSADAP